MQHNINPTPHPSDVLSLLQQTIGGEWRPTRPDALAQGFSANFPKFRSDAIVGVVNALAEQAGVSSRALSQGKGVLGNAPNAPRDVIIPRELAEHQAFREQLQPEMKQMITQVVSQQLSATVGLGMRGR